MPLKLIMEFLDSSESFAYGFECGKVYGEMRSNKRTIKGCYNRENCEQLQLCAKTVGYEMLDIQFLDEHWVRMRFRKPLRMWLMGFVPQRLKSWITNTAKELH